MNAHIPAEIAQDEEARVISRRRKFDIADDAPALGIAVSGGGIRSATVSLGVFQYLAHEEKRVRDDEEKRAHEVAASQVDEAAPAIDGEPPAPAAATIPPRPRLLSRIDY